MKVNSKYAILSVLLLSLTAISPLLVVAETTEQRPMVVGTIGTITWLDPHKTYWHTDINAYMQVCEGLFQTNLSDGPLFPIEPYLATSFGTWDTAGLTWTIPLRQDVYFTDGTLFNATAVKWNYERIQGFMEEGICEWSTLASVANQTWVDLGMGGDAEYNATKYLFILKNISISSEFEIKLGFHYKDARALSLMSFQGWVLISPEAHSKTESVNLPPLVGTGPYTIQSIESDGSRTFVANEDYWRTPAQVKTVRYQWVADSVTLGTGMLGGPGIRQYDVGGGSQEQNPTFREDPTLTFEEDVTGTVYFYAGMNTDEIPIHHRKAMAYALNYSYIIEDWFEGNYLYMTTPVTPGIPYAKIDCNVPYQDYDIARNYLISAGDSGGLDASATDQDWIDLAESGSPIASYNVSYREGSSTWGAISQLFQDNCKMIGIATTPEPMDSATLDTLINVPANFPRVRIFFLGWGPDYLDPHNMIYDAFAGPSALNPMNLAGSTNATIIAWVAKLEEAVLEQDPLLREAMYHEIQCELVEDIVPWAMLFTTKETYLFSTEVTGMSLNPFGDAYWYSCVFNPVTPAPVIPGYSLPALFGALGIAVLFLVKKYRK